MWAASCLASCCAACVCDACRTVVSGISRKSARIAYCGLFALSLIVAWILSEVAAPLMEKIPSSGEMFQAARSIMSWLGECAKPVRWTTPLGLPVVQPYCKKGGHLIRASLQMLTLERETEKIMVKRQRSAFPQNFVHSLDGSHMMMTADCSGLQKGRLKLCRSS